MANKPNRCRIYIRRDQKYIYCICIASIFGLLVPFIANIAYDKSNLIGKRIGLFSEFFDKNANISIYIDTISDICYTYDGFFVEMQSITECKVYNNQNKFVNILLLVSRRKILDTTDGSNGS